MIVPSASERAILDVLLSESSLERRAEVLMRALSRMRYDAVTRENWERDVEHLLCLVFGRLREEWRDAS